MQTTATDTNNKTKGSDMITEQEKTDILMHNAYGYINEASGDVDEAGRHPNDEHYNDEANAKRFGVLPELNYFNPLFSSFYK
jgi:hypothetical protein